MVNSVIDPKLNDFLKKINSLNKSYVFSISVIPILLFFSFFVPVGEAPDEPAHILRVDSVRHFSIAGFRFDV